MNTQNTPGNNFSEAPPSNQHQLALQNAFDNNHGTVPSNQVQVALQNEFVSIVDITYKKPAHSVRCANKDNNHGTAPSNQVQVDNNHGTNNEASELGTILVANSDDAHEGDITMEGDENSTGNPKAMDLQMDTTQENSEISITQYIATKGPEPRSESTVDKNKHLIGYAMVNLALPRCGGKGPSLIAGPVQRDISKKILDNLIEATMTMYLHDTPQTAIVILMNESHFDHNSCQMVGNKDQEKPWQDLRFTERAAEGNVVLLAGHHHWALVQHRLNWLLSKLEALEKESEKDAFVREQTKGDIALVREEIMKQGTWLAAIHSRESIEADHKEGMAIMTQLATNTTEVYNPNDSYTHLQCFMHALKNSQDSDAREQVYKAYVFQSNNYPNLRRLIQKHKDIFESFISLTPMKSFDKVLPTLSEFLTLSSGLWDIFDLLATPGSYTLYALIDGRIKIGGRRVEKLIKSLGHYKSLLIPNVTEEDDLDSDLSDDYTQFLNKVDEYTKDYNISFFQSQSPPLQNLLTILIDRIDWVYDQYLVNCFQHWGLGGQETVSDQWRGDHIRYMGFVSHNIDTVVEEFLHENRTLSQPEIAVIKDIPNKIRLFGLYPLHPDSYPAAIPRMPFLTPKFFEELLQNILSARAGLPLMAYMIQPSLYAALTKSKDDKSTTSNNGNRIPYHDFSSAIRYTLAKRNSKAIKWDTPINVNWSTYLWGEIVILFFNHRYAFAKHSKEILTVLPITASSIPKLPSEFSKEGSSGPGLLNKAFNHWRITAKSEAVAKHGVKVPNALVGMERVLRNLPRNIHNFLDKVPLVDIQIEGDITLSWAYALQYISWPFLWYNAEAPRGHPNPVATDHSVFFSVFQDMIVLKKVIQPLLRQKSLAEFHAAFAKLIPAPLVCWSSDILLPGLWVGAAVDVSQRITDIEAVDDDEDNDGDGPEYQSRKSDFDLDMEKQLTLAQSVFKYIDRSGLVSKQGRKTVKIVPSSLMATAQKFAEEYLGNAIYVNAYQHGLTESQNYLKLSDKDKAAFRARYQTLFNKLAPTAVIASEEELDAFGSRVDTANEEASGSRILPGDKKVWKEVVVVEQSGLGQKRKRHEEHHDQAAASKKKGKAKAVEPDEPSDEVVEKPKKKVKGKGKGKAQAGGAKKSRVVSSAMIEDSDDL
ncbi:hypothetical protein GGU11DRAFT_793021 [Lentinula aff. detonsa]|nr:hypothetical protein GGU11DRAFT_793021 [Lentinula aff. detonsa]